MATAKVMVVEDEAILAKGIELMLRGGGYEVVGPVASGEEALPLARAGHPDLVLMDMRLAGALDGVETAERLRAERDLPVIFLTAYADPATVARAKQATPYGYLVKPFDDALLLITVEMALWKHGAERKIRGTMDELTRANARLERSEALLQALFRSVPCGVMAVDRQGRVRTLNAFLERLFGLGAAEAVGQPMGAIFGCPRAEDSPGSCGRAGCTSDCSFRAVAEEAFDKGVCHRRDLDYDALVGGHPKSLHLSVSAATGASGEETLCFLLIEDRTEISQLRDALRAEVSFAGLVGGDGKMRDLYETIREVAEGDVPVLIQGESGTGKELVAMAIHAEGPRAGQRFVAVNCGALPEGLLESELFGHERGAFTGAIREKRGRFELADGGTLFLDEVGELSPAMQVKLLRVLQTGTFERVGGEKTHSVKVRVLSATNRDLRSDVAAGRFRGDLFYRLCVIPIAVPPLRERAGDIPLLIEHILGKIAEEQGRGPLAISPEAVSLLEGHPWPGNVRELENALQFAFIKSRGAAIESAHLPTSIQRVSPPVMSPSARNHHLTAHTVAEALQATGGNRVQAAKRLGISRATLYRFLAEQAPGGSEERR